MTRSAVETRRTWFLPHDVEWAWLLLCLSGLTFAQRTAAESLSGTISATDTTRLGLLSLALVIVILQLKHLPRFTFNPISVFLVYIARGYLLVSVERKSRSTRWEKPRRCWGLWSSCGWPWHGRIERSGYGGLHIGSSPKWLWRCSMSRLAMCWISMDSVRLHPEVRCLLTPGASPRISSNLVSQIGALLSLFCLALASEKRGGSPFLILCCVVAAVFPALSQGRTGMVSLAVGTVLILARKFPVLSVVTVAPIAGLAAVLFGDKLVTLFLRGQDNALLFSLSGRTTWWELGWAAFLRRPVLGAGWGVGSRVAVRQFGGIVMADVSTLHNGFLEVLLGVGLVGFAIWACVLVWSYGLAIAAYLRNDSLPFVVGLVVCATATLLSTGIGGGLDFITQYFLAVTALLWVQGSSKLRPQESSATTATDDAGLTRCLRPGRFRISVVEMVHTSAPVVATVGSSLLAVDVRGSNHGPVGGEL